MTTQGADTAVHRKARGAFFTPDVLARYVVQWAIRTPTDIVLEPSCGEAAFLLASGHRLADLGGLEGPTAQLVGAELHAGSAVLARTLLAEQGFRADIRVGDFLATDPNPRYDAVVGNPPYVRYQAFSGEARAVAKEAALRAGVRLTSMASSWAAFTVHASLFVRPGGRLGLVLPAEMLSVNYAAPVREFLTRSFARVRLVMFSERVFPGVQEDVVLVLADGRGHGPASHCELVQVRNGAALADAIEADVRRWIPTVGERWSQALLHEDAAALYRTLVASHDVATLQTWGDTTLGMVTGNNGFFALTGPQVRERHLEPADVIPLSPPGSRHLRGMSLTAADVATLGARGQRVWLFRPDGQPSAAARRYIRQGEARGVDTAYKCRVRSPWWRVPYLRPADLLLTYMNADTARLCGNSAGVHHLNSVHGVYLHEPQQSSADLLPLASLNSLTLLGAELVGRAYGGGILKLEPREADLWPMPSPVLVARRSAALRTICADVQEHLRTGRLLDAVAAVDAVLLDGHVLDAAELSVLREAREALHHRRLTRSKSR